MYGIGAKGRPYGGGQRFRDPGTTLLIEDEDMVADVTRAMLERSGYRVLVAKTGEEAIQAAETFDDPIDLAVLDLRLPDADGERLYPLLMQARPHLKVIVISGYDLDGPAQDVLDAGAQAFIQKPFSFTRLLDEVRRVMTDG